jgi:chromate reductase, NAD(P)H dehydrogenase (quinone)
MAFLRLTQGEEQNPPAKVAELKTRIREANAILFVTPEYNWSVSDVLKNAIDWASRPHGDSAWNGKPAAIMRASTGAIGTVRAQLHLRQILVYLDMFPINQPEVMISHAMDRFDQEGNLTDVPTREQIIGLLQNLVDWARRIGPKNFANHPSCPGKRRLVNRQPGAHQPVGHYS